MDFLILGGGTSGAYLASRILDQNDANTVTIVEAGAGDFSDPNIRLSSQIGKIMFNPEYIRTIKTEEGDVAFGSVLGGGSSVNGAYMVFPSNEYLHTLDDAEAWISIRDELKSIFPTEEKKAGSFMRTLNTYLKQLLINDTFYISKGNRISSLSFLERYCSSERLTILAKRTVHSVRKVEDTFHINMTDGTEITSNNVIMCCGAATPEILMRSMPSFRPSPVFNHSGVKLSLDKKINFTAGQIFFEGQEGYTAQILIYGKDVNIYNLNPDQGWNLKLSSRGEMYYAGKQMSASRKKKFDIQVLEVKTALVKMGYSVVNEGISPAYHMTGGCSHVLHNFEMRDMPGLYIVDLSILPSIVDANTSFMSFMLVEKFMRDVL